MPHESQNKAPLLQMQGIYKSFPGVKALKNAQIDLYEGEVHILMGENGAGKSTLMKVLCGNYHADEGEILMEGNKVSIHSPHDAQKLGISMIHQELMLAENVTVAQNMFMGREILKNKFFGTLDRKEMNKRADAVLNGMLNAGIKVTKRVNTLSVAQKQLVEIARAILSGARIIIMDEPTSSLTSKDIDSLFKVISQLKEKGTSIVYISHRMEEISKIGDKVTVMRDGEYVSTVDMDKTDIEELIRMMVGRNLEDKFPKRDSSPGEVVLSVDHITQNGVIEDISFEVRKGEVLGIFGLIGAGRTELAKAIFGVEKLDAGEIRLNGKTLHIKSPVDAIKEGIGLIPEDRKLEGLVGIMSVSYNTTLPIIDRIKKFLFVNVKKQKEIASEYVKALSVKTPSLERPVRNLSGGNQQKVVIAKWLSSKSKVLIFDEPTRGIDVGAKIEIYKIINDLLEKGTAVIMISSEMPELLGVSDRIMVMKNGRAVAQFDDNKVTQEEILKWAL